MSSLGKAEVEELQAIAARDGTLKPASVLDAARDPASILHKHFEWDDTAAAEAHRLAQAGMLIRKARVTITPREGAPSVNVRAFVSLEADRGKEGYRTIEAVIASPALMREMLAAALHELVALKRKYSELSELTGVFAEVDRLLARTEQANTQGSMNDAVTLAISLERDNGLDRVTAAHRAAAAHKLRGDDVVEALRKAS